MKNDQSQDEFVDELSSNIYLELYKRNQEAFKNLRLSSLAGGLGTAVFVGCAANVPNNLASGACWGLAAVSGLFTLYVLSKRQQLFDQIENETVEAVEKILKAQKKISAVVGPIASMLGLNIEILGRVSMDEKNIYDMPGFTVGNGVVVDTSFEVIDEGEIDLPLSQERAFALKCYIEEVAYEGYEEDLVEAERLVMEICACKEPVNALSINYEVNNLAKKAYAKALDLYSIGR